MASEPDPPVQPKQKLPIWSHLPLPLALVGAGVLFGYNSCNHLLTGFDLLMLFMVPQTYWVCATLLTFSCWLLAWRTPKGKRAFVILLHFPIVVAVAMASVLYVPPAGRWLWEQVVLRPRKEALVEFARRSTHPERGPVEVQGYRFEGFESDSRGTMFYTVMAGGPFASFGVYVPVSEGYRGFTPPEAGEPREARSVTSTSVPGLFWFITRN